MIRKIDNMIIGITVDLIVQKAQFESLILALEPEAYRQDTDGRQ